MATYQEIAEAFHRQRDEISNYEQTCLSLIKRFADALAEVLGIRPDGALPLGPERVKMFRWLSTDESKRPRERDTEQTMFGALDRSADGSCHLIIVVAFGRPNVSPMRHQGFKVRAKIVNGSATLSCDGFERTFPWTSDTQQAPALNEIAQEVTASLLDGLTHGFQRVLEGKDATTQR